MKKIIAVIIAVCLVMSTGITALAEDKKVTSDELMAELQGAVDYLSKESYTVDDALELYYLVSSGAEVNNVDSFATAVKENLSANDGKLVTSNGETLTAYAAAIQIMMYVDIEDDDTFSTLLDNFSKMDPTVLPASPYEYNVIIPASIFVEDESFGKTLCDTLIENYYEKGNGMNYYGLGCDNTAYLITALSTYSFDYEEVISDCLAVLETYKVDGGYCYNREYGTEPNADSTALALMALCSAYFSSDEDNDEIKEACDSAYNALTSFKGSSVGVYTYMNDGDNAFATADALRGISLYYIVVAIDELFNGLDDYDFEETTKPSKEETTSQIDKTEKETTEKTNAEKKSPATGDNIFGAAFGIAFCTAAFAVITAKKKESR
ncbi:MAG: hypothetical protein J1E81_01030 [Eubacterium sp.]|nr:hypothetical protein [Eubacterium sp.]